MLHLVLAVSGVHFAALHVLWPRNGVAFAGMAGFALSAAVSTIVPLVPSHTEVTNLGADASDKDERTDQSEHQEQVASPTGCRQRLGARANPNQRLVTASAAALVGAIRPSRPVRVPACVRRSGR